MNTDDPRGDALEAPVSSDAPTVSESSPAGSPADRVSRREWLETVGKVAGGATLLGTLSACGSDESDPPGGSDVGSATGGDAGTDASTDTETPDAGPSVEIDEPDMAEPPAQLTPVRGDGSHPFDYIDTVVIVQMENRSFDHYFGALSLNEGRMDVNGLGPGISNLSSKGVSISPARLPQEAFIFEPDPPHGHNSVVRQFNGGANDGFVTEFEPRVPAGHEDRIPWVMGYHDREQLPVYYDLADNFALFDQWHCSLLGPTWPNRFYSHCASSGGLWGNSSSINEPQPYSKLMAAGGTFGVYAMTPVHFTLLLDSLPYEDQHIQDLQHFVSDAAEGRLPNVSIVEPSPTFNDDHPPNDLAQGMTFVHTVYEALRTSPQWDRCLMLVFYDEHGGFYDHVAPPKVQGEGRAALGFDQLGIRVPGFAIGPLVKRGEIIHTLVDHASVPSLISNIFGLDHVNQRSELAGDLGAALDLSLVLDKNRPAPPKIEPLLIDAADAERGMRRPFSQPELWAFGEKRGLVRGNEFARRRQLYRRYFDAVERLGSGRFR